MGAAVWVWVGVEVDGVSGPGWMGIFEEEAAYERRRAFRLGREENRACRVVRSGIS